MLNIQTIRKHSSNMNVLYAEDDKDTREATTQILECFFDNVVVACNGLEGIELFKTLDIDLVVADISMPVLDGLEMIKEIKKRQRNVYIFIISAFTSHEHFIQSIGLGIDAYFLKPMNFEQLTNEIKQIAKKQVVKDKNENILLHLNQCQEMVNLSSVVSKTDLDGKITYVNDKFSEISGYSREELINQNHNIVRHPATPDSCFEEMWDTIKSKKKVWQGTIRNQTKNGDSYYVQTTIKPILDRDGNIVEYISLRNDITDIMNKNKQLQDIIQYK